MKKQIQGNKKQNKKLRRRKHTEPTRRKQIVLPLNNK